MNLTTEYLGLSLPNPIVVGASPLSDDVDTIKRLETPAPRRACFDRCSRSRLRARRWPSSSISTGTATRSPKQAAFFQAHMHSLSGRISTWSTCAR